MSEIKLCKLDGVPLLTKGERRIGICTECIASSKYAPVQIPRPIYNVKEDNGETEDS